MTVNDREPERWVPIPDAAPGYEVSWDGNFRALDRVTPSGRRLEGQPIATTRHKDGYVLVKYLDKDGKRVTRQAHRVQLEAFVGKCPEGMEARHYDDVGTNNRWRPGAEDESRARGGNLFWGTPEQNREDRRRNTPAPPGPPVKDCVECSKPFQGNSRRCHPCVVNIGRSAAEMLARGQTLGEVAKKLNYPSPEGVHTLAVRYGGYGARKSWWSRRVTPTLRDRLPGRRSSRRVSRREARSQQAGKGAPEGRKSVGGPPRKPGQTGTIVSPNVAERDHPGVARNPPKVTDRDRPHVPYPADLTRRDPQRTRDRPAGRAR